jgi:hypothetical protein
VGECSDIFNLHAHFAQKNAFRTNAQIMAGFRTDLQEMP